MLLLRRTVRLRIHRAPVTSVRITGQRTPYEVVGGDITSSKLVVTPSDTSDGTASATPNGPPKDTPAPVITPRVSRTLYEVLGGDITSSKLVVTPPDSSDGTASATPNGPPKDTPAPVITGQAITSATTEVTTDDGPFKAQATTIEVTSDDGPFRATVSKAETPVPDLATEYGTSTLTKGQRPSSEATVAPTCGPTKCNTPPGASNPSDISSETSIKPKLTPSVSISYDPSSFPPGPPPSTSSTVESETSTGKVIPLPSSYYEWQPNVPTSSSTASTSSGVTIFDVPKLTTGPMSTTGAMTWTTSEFLTISRQDPSIPSSVTADNGSLQTILPTTDGDGVGSGSGDTVILPSLLPGETTTTSCIGPSQTTTALRHDNTTIMGTITVLETLSISTSTTANTSNNPVNMFPTVGPVHVSRMAVGVGLGVAEPAALGSELGSYERAYGGFQSGIQFGLLKLGAQTALWGVLISSLVSKGGRRYAKEALLTVVSLILVLLQTVGVKASGEEFVGADMNDSKTSFSDGAVFGSLGGFAVAFVLLGAAGAFYVMRGIEKAQRDAGVGTDAQEWAKYDGVNGKDKGKKDRDGERERRRE